MQLGFTCMLMRRPDQIITVQTCRTLSSSVRLLQLLQSAPAFAPVACVVGKETTSAEQQEAALEGLLDLTRCPGFMHAAFLSCDCRLERRWGSQCGLLGLCGCHGYKVSGLLTSHESQAAVCMLHG